MNEIALARTADVIEGAARSGVVAYGLSVDIATKREVQILQTEMERRGLDIAVVQFRSCAMTVSHVYEFEENA